MKKNTLFDKEYKMRVLSPDDNYNYFFGYYDLQPYNHDGSRHLAHRVDFNDRLPGIKDNCEVGYISDGKFFTVAITNAWNFQQGALLQWMDDKSVIYNCFRDGKPVSVITDISSKKNRYFDTAFANLSDDRKTGLSINFARLYDFRAGYGYDYNDSMFNEKAPENDGIFVTDITQNKTRLLKSYSEIKKQLFNNEDIGKLVINHINFNPSGSRFIFLLRNFPEAGNSWGTSLIAGDLNGNMFKITGFEFNSHYNWIDDTKLMIYSKLEDGQGIYIIDTISGKKSKLNDELINKGDIHCLMHPSKTCFIGDSYPDAQGFRHLYMYDFISSESKEIYKIFSNKPKIEDIRCDLHARWDRQGIKISFDSFHSEKRQICELY